MNNMCTSMRYVFCDRVFPTFVFYPELILFSPVAEASAHFQH